MIKRILLLMPTLSMGSRSFFSRSAFALMVLVLTSSAYAETVSQADYEKIVKAQELIELEQWAEAKIPLKELIESGRSAYVQALGFYHLGRIAIEQEHYSQAIKQLSQARKLNALPADQQLQLLHTIGQLYCQQDKWKSCARVLSQWTQLAPSLAVSQDYIMIAQAYTQQAQWKQAVKPVNTALKKWKPKHKGQSGPPQNWFNLAVVTHVELQQWKQAIQRQQELLKHYPDKGSDWRQLVSLHLQGDDWNAALAAQRIGYERGLLLEFRDYQLLAQLLLNKGMPSLAGEILTDGLVKKHVEENSETLELITSSWLRAREWQRAEKTLARLNNLSPTADRAKQLAQVRIELGLWKAAIASLRQFEKLSKKQDADTQLLLGIAYINLKQYGLARSALNRAKESKAQRQVAQGWLEFLENVDTEQNLLAG